MTATRRPPLTWMLALLGLLSGLSGCTDRQTGETLNRMTPSAVQTERYLNRTPFLPDQDTDVQLETTGGVLNARMEVGTAICLLQAAQQEGAISARTRSEYSPLRTIELLDVTFKNPEMQAAIPAQYTALPERQWAGLIGNGGPCNQRGSQRGLKEFDDLGRLWGEQTDKQVNTSVAGKLTELSRQYPRPLAFRALTGLGPVQGTLNTTDVICLMLPESADEERELTKYILKFRMRGGVVSDDLIPVTFIELEDPQAERDILKQLARYPRGAQLRELLDCDPDRIGTVFSESLKKSLRVP